MILIMKKTIEVNVSRLRLELSSFGIEQSGSRSELINKLHQAGVFEINTETLPVSQMTNTYHPSNIIIGSNPSSDSKFNQLNIANNINTILSGDFKTKTLNVHDCLHIVETKSLSCDTVGHEGDLRMNHGILYMYRSTEVNSGWYSISFGRPLIF